MKEKVTKDTDSNPPSPVIKPMKPKDDMITIIVGFD